MQLPTPGVYVNKPGVPYSQVGYPARSRVVHNGTRSYHGLCEILALVAVFAAAAGAIFLAGQARMLKGVGFRNPFGNLPGLPNIFNGNNVPEVPPNGKWGNLPRFPEPNVLVGPHIDMRFTTVQFTHPTTGNKITTRGYGSIPGPTIRVNPGETITVTLTNQLTMPDPECMGPLDDVCHLNTTNLHTHGLHISGRSPSDSIFVSVKPKQSHTYTYKIRADHMGGTHWYHPHYHHSTSTQAGGGAHGALIVADRPGALPAEIANAREITLVVSMLNIEELTQNPQPYNEDTLLKFSAGAEDVCFVNGNFQPRIPLEGGKWTRLRFVYAAIERTLSIPISGGCQAELIAKDGIYLNAAPRSIDTVWLVPGGRADIMIRCDADTRREVMIESRGHSVVKGMGYNTEMTYNNVLMVLDVFPNRGARDPDLKPFKTRRPCYLADLRKAAIEPGNRHVVGLHPTQAQLTPDYFGKFGSTDWQKAFYVSFDGRGQSWPHNAHMGNPNEKPPPAGTFPVGSVQEWTVKGVTVHPFHMHVSPFQIINGVNPDKSGRFFANGDWHDTYMSLLDVITIRFNADYYVGDYVLHCHLLRHEDHGMMTYFTSTGREGTVWPGAQGVEPNCIAAHGEEAGFSWVSFSR